ncbi:probable sodium/metabolite cotransporter BASS4, chloroplastic [Citrus clementina]|uniref:probable sodium/metabolite cotransporter BASS4, chloroplastic n=1 Tax=Citrus clementina TaxID=85681 RepID=UPI000CECEAAA|nr:probable sodium/metabolite cotransporter BASS4, chloroplastic [Citrus x clementina]
MAVTLQTLILTPRPSKMLSSWHRNSHFRASGSLRFSPFVTFSPGRSISRPIRACRPSDQDFASSKGLNWAKPLLKIAADNFLPLALIGGVAFGFANPSLGCLADKYQLSKFSTFAIFIVSGLTLRSGEIGAAAEAWPVGIFGLFSILLFTPYFSKLILQVQLQPQEFVTGLALFSCMPTTLSSGVALTHLAGGNSALALAMTIISNLLGIMIVPFSISKFIAAGVGISVPTKQLFKSLVLTLLIPLILGKVLRESITGLSEFVDQNRKLFSKISAIFLSLVRRSPCIVWPFNFLLQIGLDTFLYYRLLHLILLAFNAFSVWSLSVISGDCQSVFAKKENTNAVVLVASQKTLPVLVAVVEQLGCAFGESGLLVLPCVAAHLTQIIMDSFLVNFWLRRDKDLSSNNAKVA